MPKPPHLPLTLASVIRITPDGLALVKPDSVNIRSRMLELLARGARPVTDFIGPNDNANFVLQTLESFHVRSLVEREIDNRRDS